MGGEAAGSSPAAASNLMLQQRLSEKKNEMTRLEMENVLTQAANRLIASQPDLFAFTAATRQSEWNIVGHFANELRKEFPDLQCDTDVIKAGFGNMRPDVIIHRRGTHVHNLLVVEVKRRKADVKDDLAKTTRYWFRPPLLYRYGAVVVINGTEPPHVTVLENPAPASFT
jgi:hypothetical protein